MMQVTLEATRTRCSSSNSGQYARLLVLRCTNAKNELQRLAYVLVYVIIATCAVFANEELMHTTLCASEGHSSTKSSDCILLYTSCSKGAATTPSSVRIASRHVLYEKSEYSHVFYAKPLAIHTGKGVVFLGSLPFCFYFSFNRPLTAC
ncbi:uncharacterized protein K441DRAFT_108591 [Cenococcum geophilum 1.58]|uniref:uncharacterized protein n=1 Tax=Cenococcum geophilum 1.58 TaxID=794803 RepID=UPI00358FC2B7|nr:hypothetical protein K441DRAFT_108591 [Cenococcum geophilum 1.58]